MPLEIELDLKKDLASSLDVCLFSILIERPKEKLDDAEDTIRGLVLTTSEREDHFERIGTFTDIPGLDWETGCVAWEFMII